MDQIILRGLILVWLIIPRVVFAENPIGLIQEGYGKGCVVQRKGKGPSMECEHRMNLFEGDIVRFKAGGEPPVIRWLSPPYTRAESRSGASLEVVFERPKERGFLASWLSTAREFVGLVEPKHTRLLGATKGERERLMEIDDQAYTPRPGYDSTLLPGFAATFAWDKEGGKTIVFKDSSGTPVFKRDLDGKTSIELTPEEIGLKSVGIYTWEIEGATINEVYRLTLLGDDMAGQIIKGLEEIDRKAISHDEKKILKALSLQLMSDTFSGEIDLYGLSYEMLKQIEDDPEGVAAKLRDRFLGHLEDTFAGK